MILIDGICARCGGQVVEGACFQCSTPVATAREAPLPLLKVHGGDHEWDKHLVSDRCATSHHEFCKGGVLLKDNLGMRTGKYVPCECECGHKGRPTGERPPAPVTFVCALCQGTFPMTGGGRRKYCDDCVRVRQHRAVASRGEAT